MGEGKGSGYGLPSTSWGEVLYGGEEKRSVHWRDVAGRGTEVHCDRRQDVVVHSVTSIQYQHWRREANDRSLPHDTANIVRRTIHTHKRRHLHPHPITPRRLRGMQKHRVPLRDGHVEARDGVGLEERPVGFDDRQRVVVDGEVDHGFGARVHEPETVPKWRRLW